MADCAVLYLERWCNNPHFARAFFSSMHRFDAGADFDFVHVLKGFKPGTESAPLKEYRSVTKNKIDVFHVEDKKSALDAMLDVARQLPHEKILVFLSWSRILAPFWLRAYLSAFDTVASCGIVGATSGFERNNYKDLSQPFPNIGIRSTGMMLPRKMFIDCADGRLATRAGELSFESGPEGMTKQIMRQGLKPVIVDSDGKPWLPEDWPRTRTFRSGNQEKLLVADNRTHDYDTSKNKRRRWLADINWGDGVADVPNVSLVDRLKAEFAWRYRYDR